jgi:hypothetical protein
MESHTVKLRRGSEIERAAIAIETYLQASIEKQSESLAADGLSVMVDEYKELGSEIRLRIDLQQRNMNVLVVLITAITGYLLTYIGNNPVETVTGGAKAPYVLLLLPTTVLIADIFLWRHLDHDINIIDKAAYVRQVIQPRLTSLTAQSVLGFEEFLNLRRHRRPRRIGPLLALGQDHAPLVLVIILYLACCWIVWVNEPNRLDVALEIFNAGTYVASVCSVISALMSMAVGREYRTIGK